MNVENCDNCGTIIGKLEQAYVVEDKIVCSECYHKLKSKNQADNNTIVRRSDPQAVVAMPVANPKQANKSGGWFSKLIIVALLILLFFAWIKIEQLEELRVEDAMEGGDLQSYNEELELKLETSQKLLQTVTKEYKQTLAFNEALETQNEELQSQIEVILANQLADDKRQKVLMKFLDQLHESSMQSERERTKLWIEEEKTRREMFFK
ncbi:MAG: hypothetical protein ISS77_07820 [Phycisphaerae bacterium]|nr:hypothetical protein [Phycisphaerae bacterium]